MKKVLIVDDERKIRSLYNKLLTFENYEVIEAEDSQSATHFLISEKDIRLILLDINMPLIDGGTLYDLVRMYDRNIKIIVTSAYPLEDQKNKIVRADDYYDKSQATEILIEKVKNVFKEKKNDAD
jgi:CheY-like chemotaxis protein